MTKRELLLKWLQYEKNLDGEAAIRIACRDTHGKIVSFKVLGIEEIQDGHFVADADEFNQQKWLPAH